MTSDELLAASQVCTDAGITYRQLTYWTAGGAIDATLTNKVQGQGHRRYYHRNLLEPLRLAGHIARILEQRRTIAIVADVLAHYPDGALELGHGIRLTWTPSASERLIEEPETGNADAYHARMQQLRGELDELR